MAEAKLTKKQQKAAQFKAGKKGKAAAIEDHPATPDDIPEDIPAPTAPEASTSAKPSKAPVEASAAETPAAEAPVKEEKRNKKRKRLAAEAEALAQAGVTPDEPAPKAKSKDEAKPKASKSKSKSKSKPDPVAPAKKTTFGDDGEVAAEATVEATPATTSEPTAKNNKYILFVGNMAFSTTSESISKHFGQACGETPNVRLLTRKADPNALASLPASKRKSIAKGKALDPTQPQSKGCAFVEFQTSEALRKALKFHHTLLEGRKINVELTAGGGGKGEARQEKIKAKNAGLEKERAKLHAKHIAPKNEERKRKGDREGTERESKRSRPDEQEKGEGWGRNGGRERKMPRFMATGSNAVRVAPTS